MSKPSLTRHKTSVMMDENTLWRTQTYALLARLLTLAPDQPLLDNLTSIQVTEPESPMGKQWTQLIAKAELTNILAVEQEYQSLFIGVTQGELIPYGCYYQTGFLMEEPLAKLRQDLSHLGLERQNDTAELEDHAAALCDVMRLLLSAEDTPIITPKAFFNEHLQPWINPFFKDMQQAKSSRFYQSLGQFAATFMALEATLLIENV